MSHRTFIRCLLAIGALILVATWPPGVLLGVFFGFGLAFFVAGPSWAISAALQANGIAMDFKQVMLAIAGLYAVMVACLAIAAALAWQRANPDLGRLLCAKAALFGALPLVAWLSMQTMADAWP